MNQLWQKPVSDAGVLSFSLMKSEPSPPPPPKLYSQRDETFPLDQQAKEVLKHTSYQLGEWNQTLRLCQRVNKFLKW